MIRSILDSQNSVGLKIRRCLQRDIARHNSINQLQRIDISTVTLFIDGIMPITAAKHIEIISTIAFQEVISGATVEDIALMRRLVGSEMGVKASGGVRTCEDATKMRAAGASRIGASASVAIVNECKTKASEPAPSARNDRPWLRREPSPPARPAAARAATGTSRPSGSSGSAGPSGKTGGY